MSENKIEEIRERHAQSDKNYIELESTWDIHADRAFLLAEIDRLRGALGLRDALRHAAEQDEIERLRGEVEFLTKDLSQRFAIRYQTSAGCMCPAEANLHCQNSFCPRRNPPGVITCQGGKP